LPIAKIGLWLVPMTRFRDIRSPEEGVISVYRRGRRPRRR
jgi:hypothetical protein